MRTILRLSMATILLAVISLYSGCSVDCQSVKGALLADLLVKQYDVTPKENVSNNPYYEIGVSVMNSPISVDCQSEVNAAGPHKDGLQLLYDDNPDFNSPEQVSSQQVEILAATHPNETYEIESQIEFTADGYYLISYRLDEEQVIEERDEKNNEGTFAESSTNGRSRKSAYLKQHIFRVSNCRPNSRDSDAQNKYFSTWKIIVKTN